MRQIILDTETTGIDPLQGHRIIEIGCVEMINRQLTGKHFHAYINPNRAIDFGAEQVHGITNAFLADKPVFGMIVDEWLAFVKGAQLIIHNAPFDIGFLNNELKLLGQIDQTMTDHCTVLDTLLLARQMHPGQKNSLDALCKRYAVDTSQRTLHGALLDANLLARVYLAMTGGQSSLFDHAAEDQQIIVESKTVTKIKKTRKKYKLPVLIANAEEMSAHDARLASIDKASKGKCLWLQMEKSKEEVQKVEEVG